MEIRTVLKTDLTKPVKVQNLNGNFFSQDNQANAIYVEVTDNGEPVTLTGGITGYVVRGDGYTVVINGTTEDGKAKVVLNKGCYRVTGAISVVVKAGTTTIGACHGYVYRSSTDSIVDPEHLIPSLNDLLAQIDNCRQATTAANTAAQSANQATTAANNAAQSANEAADSIDGLTTHAQNGQTSGAVVSEVSGHKHIEFTFPTVIPDIEVDVTTLNPGESATVNINKQSPYSQEHPKITFGIPRGETGTITNASGMSIPISESDSTKIKTYIDTAIQSEQTARGLVEQRVGTLEQNALTVDAVIDALYPIGSTYISMNSTMPTALTTGRAWTPITGDYVLRTITSGTGGTLSNAGNTGSTTLTVDQVPPHTHELNYGTGSAANGTGGAYNLYLQGGSSETTKARGGGHGHTHTAGMPKNVAIYMWKRTA